MSNSSLVNYTRISPNKTSPRRNKIDRITIHHMAGNLSVETCGNVFAPSSRRASSNYGVGSDARIGMYVEEKDRSWCSSSSANDNRAVTIEVADDVMGGNWHSSAKAMESLVKLCADICRRNGISKLVYTGDTSGNMTLHHWFSNTDCPGNYLESKMTWIASEVNKILTGGSYSAPSDITQSSYRPEDKGYLIKGDYGQAVKVMQQMLMKCGYSVGSCGADGSFGNDTLTAVKAFQKDNGLAVDGSYGSKTKAKLTEVYNSKFTTQTASSSTSSGKIAEDGLWGTETTKKAQAVFGMKIIDGIVSNQWKVYKDANPGLTSGWDWHDRPNGQGSNLIRAIQKWAGMPEKEIDGEIGDYTIKSIQKRLGCSVVDGYFSNPSNCIKAFQKWLNAQ